MKKLILILVFTMIPAMASAATLRWGTVEDVPDNPETAQIEGYTIEGYCVYWRVSGSSIEPWKKVLQNVNDEDLSQNDYKFLPGITYEFAVSAYSTTHQEGPKSVWVTYTAPMPQIEGNPQPDNEEIIIPEVKSVLLDLFERMIEVLEEE